MKQRKSAVADPNDVPMFTQAERDRITRPITVP
jgi:hypothetical protein